MKASPISVAFLALVLVLSGCPGSLMEGWERSHCDMQMMLESPEALFLVTAADGEPVGPRGTIGRPVVRKILEVKATAYNADPRQTDSTPNICAWGDEVRPRTIAVSRDLEQIGLTRGRVVFVEGLGRFTVLDRMHKRKRGQIDIFMEEYDDAVKFGLQRLTIRWQEGAVEKTI